VLAVSELKKNKEKKSEQNVLAVREFVRKKEAKRKQ
jgi:hypothetical protein